MATTTRFSKWLIIAAITIYTLSLAFYILHFGGYGFSSDTSVWGQFGDFMGGAVNPILGMITIWFLAVTLKQTAQSHDEQLTFSAESRDFEACIALISYYEKSGHEFREMAHARRVQFELSASNSLKTLGNTDEDKQIYESLMAMKADTVRETQETENKAQQFFNLANELKPILKDVHSTLRKRRLNN